MEERKTSCLFRGGGSVPQVSYSPARLVDGSTALDDSSFCVDSHQRESMAFFGSIVGFLSKGRWAGIFLLDGCWFVELWWTPFECSFEDQNLWKAKKEMLAQR